MSSVAKEGKREGDKEGERKTERGRERTDRVRIEKEEMRGNRERKEEKRTDKEVTLIRK